jgi:hypothetical protein
MKAQEIKWYSKYSETNEVDKFGRWARVAKDRDQVLIAWVNRVEFEDRDGDIEEGTESYPLRVFFSTTLYFPTVPNNNSPNEIGKFDTAEEAKEWVAGKWTEFVNRILK